MSDRFVTINGRRVRDPRDSRAWRQLVQRVVSEEPTCWLGLPRCTGASTTADHVIPFVDRPDLALERTNLRGACRNCNEDRGRLPVTSLDVERPAAALGLFD